LAEQDKKTKKIIGDFEQKKQLEVQGAKDNVAVELRDE
jgi:hypothetical protein